MFPKLPKSISLAIHETPLNKSKKLRIERVLLWVTTCALMSLYESIKWAFYELSWAREIDCFSTQAMRNGLVTTLFVGRDPIIGCAFPDAVIVHLRAMYILVQIYDKRKQKLTLVIPNAQYYALHFSMPTQHEVGFFCNLLPSLIFSSFYSQSSSTWKAKASSQPTNRQSKR